MASWRSVFEGFDRLGSTHAAEGDATEDVLDGSRAELRINDGERRLAAEGAVRALEPSCGRVTPTERRLRERDDPRQPIDTIRLVSGQPALTSPPLEASRRQVEARSQLFDAEIGSLHELLDYFLREPLANRGLQIDIPVQTTSKDSFAAELVDD